MVSISGNLSITRIHVRRLYIIPGASTFANVVLKDRGFLTNYLNIWVAGKLQCSVPIVSENQKSAAGRISQGARDGQVFMLIEDEAREVFVSR